MIPFYLYAGFVMSVLNHMCDDQPECPLCMEAFEVDDLNFFPCTCGYQICRFCWHRIRTDENGLCPACRKPYPEDPADFKPLSREEVAKLKAEKRQKHQQKKNKITEDRKVLNNMRVLQKNLVFVVGLPNRISEAETLKKHEYFGKFGKILKVVINQSTSYIGTQGPSASAYVTYSRCEDALRAILAVNNVIIDNRVLKASLGTTKYCSNFMKNQPCPKTDCMYLHEMGEPEASFTKDEMQQGKHQEYEKKLYEQYNVVLRRPENSPPIQISSGNNGVIENLSQNNKESWPSLNNGTSRNDSPVEDDRLYEVEFNLTNHNSHSDKTLEKVESQNVKINGHKNKKKSSSPENRKGKVKTPSSIPSAEEEQLSTLDGECTENKRNLIKEIWNNEPSLSNNQLENDTQSESLFENPQKPASIFEQDNNNSFFSSNFSKLTNGKTSPVLNSEPDWSPPVSAILPPIPDVLPQVQTSEDWQAAFGFSNNSNSSQNNYPSSDLNRTMLNLPSDDDIFDSVSVTQRALSEYMEQQNHINMYQSRLQNSGFPYCTKLMDNLHINNTAPTRTCLPPPGFSSAPNQVNSYGISIPRNTGNTNKLPQNNPFALQQQLRQSSSHNLDWSSIDPAIVTATPHCNLYTTPPPPPGFNMRQAFDSNLWLFNNLI
ncbi:CCR4-NOT transcription complex subunit 4 isoform X3 [Myzus persicae]|uniref:CCR4-NOT transcription complex subunit 4 isoform X3 n=1 Tax=Myzus persicae TaxID=13164 RepID=UPI000B9339CE|nr:CCR4-NOT transcription complex subunit 4 isoform X3 [Myzus persicae]